MVEGGKIDWACHGNDAATVFTEVIDMAEAVEKALDFQPGFLFITQLYLFPKT